MAVGTGSPESCDSNCKDPNTPGRYRSWKVMIHQLGIYARLAVMNEEKLTNGAWALMRSLCEYGNPSNEYTVAEVKKRIPLV